MAFSNLVIFSQLNYCQAHQRNYLLGLIKINVLCREIKKTRGLIFITIMPILYIIIIIMDVSEGKTLKPSDY